MNDYFNAPDNPVEFTLARAEAIRAIFAAIAHGFDLLPELAALFQGRVNFAVAGGTANAVTAEFGADDGAYENGASIRLLFTATNTGAATLNVSGLGAVPIVDASGAALVGGELVNGHLQELVYVNGAFYLPASGPQGPRGYVGLPGGLTIMNGVVDPDDIGDGVDGDFFINTNTWQIFGPKAGGAWPAGVDILGTDGVDGNTILNGADDPDGADGIDGDFYINTTTWKIFGPKAAGAWPAGHDIMDLDALALTGTNTVNPDGTAHEIGFRDLPKSRTVSANFTLASADRGCFVEYNDTGDTCTVPLNSSVAIPIGGIIVIVNTGAGALAINREAGVTMKLVGTGADANRSLAVGGYAWIHKINTNTWFISGGGVT